MPVPAGSLREPCVFERRITKRGKRGGVEPEYEVAATVWGAYEALAGRERFQGMQVRADVDARVVVLFDEKLLNPVHRVKVMGRYHKIVSVLPRPTRDAIDVFVNSRAEEGDVR